MDSCCDGGTPSKLTDQRSIAKMPVRGLLRRVLAKGRCDMAPQSWGLVVLVSLVTFSCAQNSNDPPPAPADHSARLPVKRVVLYKNGVGYFEHSAHVRGNQDLGIDFTTAQLNDV